MPSNCITSRCKVLRQTYIVLSQHIAHIAIPVLVSSCNQSATRSHDIKNIGRPALFNVRCCHLSVRIPVVPVVVNLLLVVNNVLITSDVHSQLYPNVLIRSIAVSIGFTIIHEVLSLPTYPTCNTYRIRLSVVSQILNLFLRQRPTYNMVGSSSYVQIEDNLTKFLVLE